MSTCLFGIQPVWGSSCTKLSKWTSKFGG